jgi:uncharacterized membrane protein YhhN
MRCATRWIPTRVRDPKAETPMTGYWLLGLALIFAVADWLTVFHHRRRLEYVFKPLTLVAVLLAAWLFIRSPHAAWQACFFLPGLALSLVGDVCLMLRRERLFLVGLGAFLLAHTCYVVGLNPALPTRRALILLLPVALVSGALYRAVARGLRQREEIRLRVPVAVYSLVLSLMLFSAWSTLFRSTWTHGRRALVVAGGSLFFVSDAMLAWDRFVAPSPSARLRVHITYHLGQMALAASIAMAS